MENNTATKEHTRIRHIREGIQKLDFIGDMSPKLCPPLPQPLYGTKKGKGRFFFSFFLLKHISLEPVLKTKG
jgi:hypothetical protein